MRSNTWNGPSMCQFQREGKRGDVHDLHLSSPLCNGSPVNPTLCNFRASYWSGFSLLARNIHCNEQAHVDGRSEELPDVGPGHITMDHTGGVTFGGAGLGACVCEGSECLLAVGTAQVGILWNDIKEGNKWQGN